MAEEKGRNEKGRRRNKSIGPSLAVWALLAKSSIYKVFAILAAMVSVEVLLFYHSMKREWGNYVEYRTLTSIVEDSRISVVFLVALGLLYFTLAWTEGKLHEKSGITMRRLRLSGGRLFAIKAAYNMACLAMLFVVQIWLCIWLVEAYGQETAELYDSPQRLFLAFYRIDFLHCMMPMAEVGKWVRNLLLLLTLSMEAAVGVDKANKKSYVPQIFLYEVTLVCFVCPMGVSILDVLCYVVCFAVNAVHVVRAWKADEKYVW